MLEGEGGRGKGKLDNGFTVEDFRQKVTGIDRLLLVAFYYLLFAFIDASQTMRLSNDMIHTEKTIGHQWRKYRPNYLNR